MSFSNKISVVVPTYNSMLLLNSTLRSFLDQTVDKSCFEIIVVDDGSKDGTRFLVDEYRDQLDISYYYLEDKGFRLAAARNVGLHFAKYSLVLFFDCGMLASNELLESHLRKHEVSSNCVLIGMSYGVEEFSMVNARELDKILNGHTLADAFSILRSTSQFNDCRYDAMEKLDFDLSPTRCPWVVCWGGHMSCGTSDLRRIGGFDEYFNSWGGEDVELAIRLHRAGCTFEVLNSLEAIHAPHFKEEEENINSSRKNIQYIIKKHPQPEVELLGRFGWEDIFARQDAKVELSDSMIMAST